MANVFEQERAAARDGAKDVLDAVALLARGRERYVEQYEAAARRAFNLRGVPGSSDLANHASPDKFDELIGQLLAAAGINMAAAAHHFRKGGKRPVTTNVATALIERFDALEPPDVPEAA